MLIRVTFKGKSILLIISIMVLFPNNIYLEDAIPSASELNSIVRERVWNLVEEIAVNGQIEWELKDLKEVEEIEEEEDLESLIPMQFGSKKRLKGCKQPKNVPKKKKRLIRKYHSRALFHNLYSFYHEVKAISSHKVYVFKY